MTTAFVRPRQLYAWKGPSLLITNVRGECGSDELLSGFYFREARHLNQLQFAIDREPLWLCEAAAAQPDRLLFQFLYPEIQTTSGGGTGQAGDEEDINESGIPYRAIHISVSYEVRLDGLRVHTIVQNRSRRAIECEFSWALDADFADIQEAQGNDREQNARVDAGAAEGVVTFDYRHDRLPLRTVVQFESGGWHTTAGGASRRLRLPPQAREEFPLRIIPIPSENTPLIDDVRAREALFERWRECFAHVLMPGNRLAESVVASNVRDIASFAILEGVPDEWLTLQAGMPLYPAVFGRDALTAGWQAAFLDRGASLEAALTRLARMQSDRDDDWRDEEPGRIPYQIRSGPLALLDINPYSAYYADFASPLMFVVSLAHLYSWTGQRAHLERHWDTVQRILEWARTRGDRDGDGYLEYLTRSSKGTKNQGWKDSGDAVIYDDGSPVPPPIGTCELQGYWFAAQQLAAVMSGILGRRDDARELWRNAMDLKSRFNRDWWVDDASCVALAMDPQKRLVTAVTSNAGHCLTTGIVDGEHLPRLVGRLFAPDMFSGWGIRTLSSEHTAYDPLSYHRGTVWPVEQATIAFGLRRFGYDVRANELARAMFDVALLYPDYRIPECIGGFSRGERATPAAYPRANTPQLWNASAFPLLIHTMLGFQPAALLETLIVDPDLPTWMPEIVVENLRLGGAMATLRFWRDDAGHSHAEVLRSRGTFRLVVQPPLESQTATLRDRVGALLETLMH